MPVLNSIVLFVKSAPASIAFYRSAMDASVRMTGDTGRYVELDVGAVSLAVIEYEYINEIAPALNVSTQDAGGRTSYISFLVNDVNQQIEKIIAAGGVVVHPPQKVPWEGVMAFVTDPDGHVIELFQKVIG